MPPVARGARFEPLGIVPSVRVQISDDGGGIGTKFGGDCVGIGLDRETISHAREDFEFVQRAFGKLGNENFPDPALAASAHGVYAPVPGVEVANYADSPSVWGPYREMNSSHSG